MAAQPLRWASVDQTKIARWSRRSIFARIFQELAQPGGQGDTLIIDIEPVMHHRFRRHRRGFMNAQTTL